MDNKTYHKLKSGKFKKELILITDIYFSLPKDKRDIFLESLDKKHATALIILQSTTNNSCTYEDLAIICDRNVNTIKGYVYALEEIGFSIAIVDKISFKATGRKRVVRSRYSGYI